MKVLIKEVKPNVVDREDPNNITSYWIYGLLENGRELKIFDSETFDLRDYENQVLDLLIFCKLSNIPDNANKDEQYYPVLEGEYLGKYIIPEIWEIGWRFESIKKEEPISFHAIQTNSGRLIIKSNNLKNYSIKPGDRFRFKVVGLDLMAWKQIESKEIIDFLAFEKKIIAKFWNMMVLTREKSEYNTSKQIELLKKELMNWNYDEIWLFDDILSHLSTALRINHNYYKEKLGASVEYMTDFYRGIVALGKNAYNKALLEPKKFFQDILDKKYSDNPRELELATDELIQNVMETKSGKSIDYVIDLMLRKDIEEVRDRIGSLLDTEFDIDWNK